MRKIILDKADPLGGEEVKSIIIEISKLIKPTTFIIHIYGIYGAVIKVVWLSDISVSVEEVYVCILDSRKKKRCISINDLQLEIEKLKQRVLDVCDASDKLAERLNKSDEVFFETLLEQAEELNGGKYS